MIVDWRNMENLPLASSGQWQALRPYSKKIIMGKAAVEKAISRWNQPFYPLIIARPASRAQRWAMR